MADDGWGQSWPAAALNEDATFQSAADDTTFQPDTGQAGFEKLVKGPCRICNQEGHGYSECTANRLIAFFKPEEVHPDEAWTQLQKADADRDLDDFKTAFMQYINILPDTNLADLEDALRKNNMNVYLIASEQELAVTHTIIDIHGQPGKYVLSFQFSAKPRRRRQDAGWPSSPEENLERLNSAGFVMDSFVRLCSNCGEAGHISKACPEEKRAPQEITITCALCGEGHRARDCPNPRRRGGDKECRNCGETGHISRECPSKEARTCNNCGSTEHMAKECDQPKNMANVKCRNCDELGHESRACPKPTDWSRVQCKQCGEFGHTIKRCKAESAVDESAGDGGW